MLNANYYNKQIDEHSISQGGNKVVYLTTSVILNNYRGKNVYFNFPKRYDLKEIINLLYENLSNQIFNNFDREEYKKRNFRLKRLQVVFEQKPQHFIEFTSERQVENNIELGYAISVHKAQGSEFSRVYFVLPKSKQSLLSTELLYTGITRAQKHLTVFVEGDFTTLLSMMRPEKSRLSFINSSIFNFSPLNEDLLSIGNWYEEGKIHSTLIDYFVRSKSEVIIANMLFDSGIESIKYEEPLFAADGTFYLPDFTLQWKGRTYYWEHLGLMEKDEYIKRWKQKEKWYNKFFPNQLITTTENSNLSIQAKELIQKIKLGNI